MAGINKLEASVANHRQTTNRLLNDFVTKNSFLLFCLVRIPNYICNGNIAKQIFKQKEKK